jgi:repressor LexA
MDEGPKKITAFYQKERRMPTFRELMKLAGYKSTGATNYFVEKLIDSGFLSKHRSTGRLIPGPRFATLNGPKLLGLVEAGFPSPAEEELQDTINFDEYLTPNKEASYILKVKGDSMIDAGICDGDMVIVERRLHYKPGQIVVASLDGGYTMKYLRKKGNMLYLEPANKDFAPMYPKQELTIEAVVTAVVRKYL